MDETLRRVSIEKDLRPAYYDDFHCLMGDCRISCCKGSWRITFDRKDYLKIKKQKGSPELNEKLAHCLRRFRGEAVSEAKYAEFATNGTVCPLLDENGLCSLQREKGANVLPRVCQIFPRHESAHFSGYFERSLSPACEGVLALLWELPDGIEFRSDPLPQEKRSIKILPEANPLVGMFQDVRSLCIDFLQDRRRPLPHRILLMGLALKELADGETDIPHFMERGRFLLERGDAGELLRDLDNPQTLELTLHSNVRTLLSLRNEGDMWGVLWSMGRWLSLENRSGRLFANSVAYLSARERYAERFGDRAYFMENLTVALAFHTAFPDMSSPENLWKSYVNFCNLYAAFFFTAVMSCRDGASGDRDELFRLLVLVIRSLLHSDKNQNMLRDRLCQNNSATLAHMAVLLCGT